MHKATHKDRNRNTDTDRHRYRNRAINKNRLNIGEKGYIGLDTT
jgi:hypothetical protein